MKKEVIPIAPSKAELTELRLLTHAKAEFKEQGFQATSMRNIAQKASMTTGAIYRYFPDKNKLFETLVRPDAEQFKKHFEELAAAQLHLLHVGQATMEFNHVQTNLLRMVDYIFDHYDTFDLLVNCSAGSSMENYIETLTDLDIASTQAFIQKLTEMGLLKSTPPAKLISILIKQSYRQVFEIVSSRMTREEADEYLHHLIPFLYGGWSALLGKTE